MDNSVNSLVRVNDFVVKFANVNGSGSASANGLFARAVLRMGVPVAARNIFPRCASSKRVGGDAAAAWT